MGIVWIASYPKSGNTWVRFLLANYLGGPIDDSAKVEALIPDLHHHADLGAMAGQRPVLYAKTHLAWSEGHPWRALTDRSVFILRHPKDVLLSNMNYQYLIRGDDKEFTPAMYAQLFIQHGGCPHWIALNYGNLIDHTLSWMEAPATPARLTVRYEDLKADPAGQMTRVLEFLGVTPEAERVKRAVSASSFDQMRAMEVREKATRKSSPVFDGQAPRRGWNRYFMNSGKSAKSLSQIDAGLDKLFDQRFGDLLARTGYAK